jgi:hypothetical protein
MRVAHDPCQLVWQVKEFGQLKTEELSPSSVFDQENGPRPLFSPRDYIPLP